jgi:hypothetical protein
LLSLFEQAKHASWVKGCEAERLAFFSAAEHALRVGTVNASGLFAWMVRGKEYRCVAQEDEDRARRKLSHRLEEGHWDSERKGSAFPHGVAGESDQNSRMGAME